MGQIENEIEVDEKTNIGLGKEVHRIASIIRDQFLTE